MTQKFSKIGESEKINLSYDKINFNDETLLSNSSGDTFPTANLVVGMYCWRKDRNELYQLVSDDPVTWVIRFGAKTYDFVDVFNDALMSGSSSSSSGSGSSGSSDSSDSSGG